MTVNLFPSLLCGLSPLQSQGIGRWWSSFLIGATAAGLVSMPVCAAPDSEPLLAQQPHPAESHSSQPGIVIYPPIVWPYPRTNPNDGRVRVVFEALGSDWGAVYLDGRLIYRHYNHNREKTVYLSPGGYYLEITGVAQSDVWASGYLDIGRDDSRLLVIRFSKANGVQVAGAPYVWIPDQ